MVLGRDRIAKVVDIIRGVWEGRRELREGSEYWIVGADWLRGCLDDKVTEGVTKRYGEGSGPG
jgi:hypothetical protein